VEVEAAVDRVLKAMQARAVVHVAGGGGDLQPVLGRQPVELDAAAVEGARRQRAAVELRPLDRGSDELDEGGCARLGAPEGDLGRRGERFGAGRQVEPDVVVEIRQEGGAAPRLLASQVVTNGC
jgi:hypothetical protein